VTERFADLIAANAEYQQGFALTGLRPEAAKHLAVLTCIDSRIEPLAMLGLAPGDAKIVRNAGARVTDDALRSLVVSIHFLEVERIAVVAHTRCKMTEADDDELRAAIAQRTGASTDGWVFHSVTDQRAALEQDLATLRTCPLIPASIVIGGFVYDVDSGALTIEAVA
jgi:carbonic anhydrase